MVEQYPARQFVAHLRTKLSAEGLSQRELATHLGVSEAAVSLLLTGRRRLSLDFAQRVISRWPEFAAYWAADLASGRGVRPPAAQGG